MWRRVVLVPAAMRVWVAPAAAQAPTVLVLEGFRSLLAQGEGQQPDAVEFGAYQLTGESSVVEKDLRTTLGRRVRVPHSRRYSWKVMARCEPASPPACDQNVPTALGAVDTPSFPWRGRGSHHKVVELTPTR